MRLIDADALKKYIKQEEDYDTSCTFCSYIDNAPTVENITIFAELGEDMADITREIMPQLLAKVRPQGEWITLPEFNFNDKCSVCGALNCWKRTNYCPNCGAEMRKEVL